MTVFQIVLAFDDCDSLPHLCVRFVTYALDSNICVSFNTLHTVWCDIICILYTTLCTKLITWTLHITLSAVDCMHTTHHLCAKFNTWTLHTTGSLCSALKSPELEVHTELWWNVAWSLSLSQDKACSTFSFWKNARLTENWPVSSHEAFIHLP